MPATSHMGMATLFPPMYPHKQFDPPIAGRVISHLYFFLVDRAAASGAASVAATASTAALPPSQLAEFTPHDKEDGDRDNRNNNDICHICLLSLPMQFSNPSVIFNICHSAKSVSVINFENCSHLQHSLPAILCQ